MACVHTSRADGTRPESHAPHACRAAVRATPATPSASLPDPDAFRRDPEERLRAHVDWFIKLRWLAILASAGATAACGPVLDLLGVDVWVPLAGMVAALLGCNLAYRRLATRAGGAGRLLLIQIFADLGILTAMLHFAGGAANPLHFIYVFHVVIAGIILGGNAGRLVTLACCSSFTLLAIAELQGWIAHHPLIPSRAALAADPFHVAATLVAFNLVLACTDVLTAVVVRRMRATEDRLEQLARSAILELERLDTVVNTAGAGMRLLASDLTILWCNHNIAEWFNADPELGKPCLSSFGSPVLGCTTCLCTEAMRTGHTVFAERVVRGADGKVRTYEVAASPVVNERGEVYQLVELIRDVTRDREREAQLARAGKMAAIGELAGRIAHEINNPAGVIAMKARLLLDEAGEQPLPEKAVAGLRMIDRHVQRISTITRGLLSYAKPSIERKSRQDLNAIVRATLELLGDQLQAQQVQLRVELAPSPLDVTANGSEIQQVLLNLINNAADAMPTGGTLRVSTAAENGEVRLAVTDTGVGIAPADLARIFEPFVTTKPDGRGTGLGLSISQGIVRDHGGQIEVASEPGRGSAFTVSLPRPHAGSGA